MSLFSRTTSGLALLVALAATACGGGNLPGAADFPATAAIERHQAKVDPGAEVLLERTEFRLEADGSFTRRVTQRYRITTEAGVQGWGYSQAHWSPWYMERPKITVTVTAPSGATSELDPATIAEAAAYPDAPDLYSDARILRAPLPNVVVGATIEEVIEYRTKRPFFGGAYTHYALIQGGAPRERVEVVVDAPADLAIKHELRDAEVKVEESEGDGRRRLSFTGGPYPAIEGPEPLVPSDVPTWPHVAFTTGTSWNAMAKHYQREIDQKLAALSLERVAQDVVGDAATPREKADRLLAWVHERVRYAGVELGESAIVPYTPEETLKRGYGDCKDQATLLVALLRGVGLEAHVALLRAGHGEDVRPGLPALNVFNHAIVMMPNGGDPLWIDPTIDFARVGELPSSDTERLALVIDDATEALVRTPAASSKDNRYVEERTVHLAELGHGRVVEISRGTGFVERSLRSGFRGSEEQRREWAETYAREQYNARGAVRFSVGDVADLGSPFELKIEADEARVTASTLFSAEVIVAPDSLFQYLSNALSGSDERKAPLWLPTPYQAEVRYVIVPPEGFVPEALPKLDPIRLGPVEIERSMVQKGTGVEVHYALDLHPTRWTAAEVNAFRKALGELESQEALVRFVHVGYRHSREHDPQAEIASYRKFVASHPKSGVHRMRLAIALIDLRYGDEARREAEAAVALEPDRAQLHYNHANILRRDDMGRVWGKGWNREATAAALQRAIDLDPDHIGYRLELAEVYEYDADGVRYGAGSQLAKAVEIYDAIDPDALRTYKGGDFAHNPLFALMYAGDFAEVRHRLASLPRDKTPRVIAMVTAAVLDGSAAGLAEMERLGVPQPEQAETLDETARMLFLFRRYPEAAALTEAAIARIGHDDPDLRHRLELRKTVRKIDPMTLPKNTPFAAVSRMFALYFARPDLARKQARSLVSQRSYDDEGESVVEKSLEALGGGLEGLDFTPEVVGDMTAVSYRVDEQDGDDASGYRLRLRSRDLGGSTVVHVFMVKEGGEYRLRSVGGGRELGCEALHRVKRGDTKGAARWLDWARESTSIDAGEDALRVPPFARLWKKRSKTAPLPDKDDIALAAAALCANGPMRAEAVATLERARGAAPAAEKVTIDQALVMAHAGHDDGAQLAAARRVATAAPGSLVARSSLVTALLASGQAKECKSLLVAALKKDPDDLFATFMMPLVEERLGNYAEARRLGKKLVVDGRASPRLLNELAWMALFSGAGVSDEDIDFALRATKADGNVAYLHTLATLYAEVGQVYNARVTLDRILAVRKDRLPISIDQLILGRMAEHLGLPDVARAAYQKIEKPSVDGPTSSYRMAQKRLETLKR